jgi:hypothetical protein
MIGREDELRRMAQLVTTPGTGVAILAGEPGIGKTRLVQELTRILPPDALVLAGQAEPGSLGRPFELLLSALDGEEGVDPDLLTSLTDSARTQVERLRTGLAPAVTRDARQNGKRPHRTLDPITPISPWPSSWSGPIVAPSSATSTSTLSPP